MVSLPKLRITISVIMHLVREVSTCRVFPSPIQREKVLSLEKKEQESQIWYIGEETVAWVSLGSSRSSNATGLWD